jgi:hypothetical protein
MKIGFYFRVAVCHVSKHDPTTANMTISLNWYLFPFSYLEARVPFGLFHLDMLCTNSLEHLYREDP